MIYRMQVFYVVRRYKDNTIEMKHGPFGNREDAYDAKEAHRWTADKLEIMEQIIEVTE